MVNCKLSVKSLFFSILTLPLFLSQIQAEVKLDQLAIPAGFKIEIYASDVDNARQMAASDSGIIYVGSRNAGKVYALADTNQDGKADKHWLIAKGLSSPSGLAFKDGDLYVGAIGDIIRFPDIDNNLDSPKSELFFSDLPSDGHHGWKFLRFDKTGNLIIPVGAPCNVCDITTDKHARILSLNMKTKQLTVLAEGVRNSVGFDFHPQTNELWFTDNGRDMLGDDVPSDELNHIAKPGKHYGFPFIHQGDIQDPEFGKNANAKDYVAPALKLGAHVAALGMHFYRGEMFPASFKNKLLIAEHGSWNRSKKSGYKVVLVTLDGSKVVDQQDFITGFMKNEQTFGRPAALLELADGSILISDDYADVIYRLTYSKN